MPEDIPKPLTAEAAAANAPVALRHVYRVDAWIQRVEVAVCVLALTLMVILAFAQVFLRQANGSIGPISVPQPVSWFDIVARHMVIWVGVLGASLATAEGRHISIEAAPKLLGPRGRRRLDGVVSAAAVTITSVLFTLSVIYLAFQYEKRHEQFLFTLEAIDLNVPRWPFLAVVPIGLALMGLRFALRAVESVVLDDETHAALRAEPEEDEPLEELAELLKESPPQEGAGGSESDAGGGSPAASALAEPAPPADLAPSADDVTEASEDAEAEATPASEPEALADSAAASGSAQSASAHASSNSEAHRALDSDAWESAPPPESAAPEVEDEDDLGDESEDEGEALPPRGLPRGPVSLRSTDEIPVYQDLADDEDLVEPEIRRSRRVSDSTEELEAVEGLEDLVDSQGDPTQETGSAADEALEAMARSTDRVNREVDHDDDDEDEDEVDPSGVDDSQRHDGADA